MHRVTSRRSMSWAGTALLALLLLSVPLSAAENCLKFQGIQHCAVGEAVLHLSQDGTRLVAANLGAQGEDGVASQFQPVTHWEADLRVVGGDPGDRVDLLSISNGLITSGLTLVRADGQLISNGFFTGAAGIGSYDLIVIDDGEVVGQIPGLDDRSSVTFLPGPDDGPWPPWGPGPIWPPWPPEDEWPPGGTFDIGTLGECSWGLIFSSDVTVLGPGGGRMVGDEVRYVEQVIGRGHYAYTSFNSIVMTTNGSALAILDESVSP